MDWKNFVDHFASMTCVLSVEKDSGGGAGTIRIVTGNQSYIDSIALAAGGVSMNSAEKTEFVPDSEYTRYIPKDLNFEDACYRCAVLKQPMHTVIRASRYPFDINIFFMPMEDESQISSQNEAQASSQDGSVQDATMNPSRGDAAELPQDSTRDLERDLTHGDVQNEAQISSRDLERDPTHGDVQNEAQISSHDLEQDPTHSDVQNEAQNGARDLEQDSTHGDVQNQLQNGARDLGQDPTHGDVQIEAQISSHDLEQDLTHGDVQIEAQDGARDLAADEPGGVAYCTYTQVLVPKADDNLMSLNISREMAASVISTCIKLRGDKPFREIMTEVVEDIRNICGADFCCVLLLDEDTRTCSVLGEARAEGSNLAMMEAYLNDDFYELAETWLETIGGSYCLVIQDDKDMEYIRERNPAWYMSLTSAGVEKLVIFPLMSRGRFLGYIWATNFDAEDTLRIKDTLELTTYFIASEIASNQFIEQLKKMSRMDMLTGVMNRNEMNNRVTELFESESEAVCSKGVVFADMNGLKHVNDTLGHMAGDRLLKNAAMILRSTFADDEIYRVGGDEFMILLEDTDDKEMEQKITEIKQKSYMFENVSFSAGYCSFEKESEIRKALAAADAMMYKDKEDYYRRSASLQ